MFRYEYIRTVSLIGCKAKSRLADSPGRLLAFWGSSGTLHVVAIEIKTMSALATIDKPRNVRRTQGDVITVPDIGGV
ncbi:hypothetical protein BWQ96_03105 [Gracilariopsis chorda]|uniref:Uncharacterized protein n=1 Tax=Gracilariopsis chorda TaxID=448386 RepID=A0A2V3IYM6_9FLOR|nr:hypothetical protein BWQ96_03105 [Gracilariopsis chorda]|eukprot:PXF47163.1 hypothetical protein BWQ96_03105 [Gracilariopsis chorda]